MNDSPPRYRISQLDEIDAVPCPCGSSRRAFAGSPDHVASLHLVDIKEDARTHYHKKMTEIYLVLEGEGHMELDGKLVPVKPMTAVYIQPGCRHRAVGRMKIINIPVPSFDEADEWFDDPPEVPTEAPPTGRSSSFGMSGAKEGRATGPSGAGQGR